MIKGNPMDRYQKVDLQALAKPPSQQQQYRQKQQQQSHNDEDSYHPSFIKFPAEWKRVKVNTQPRQGGIFTAMLTDITYSSTPDRPIVELHAVTEEGNSVMVNVFDFLPNFYVKLSTGETSPATAVAGDASPTIVAPIQDNKKKNKKHSSSSSDEEISLDEDDDDDADSDEALINTFDFEALHEEYIYEGPLAASLPYVERGQGKDAPEWVRDEACQLMIELDECLKQKLKKDSHIGKRKVYIEHWVLVKRKNILCYTPLDSWFVRLYLNSPKHVPKARQLLETGRVAHMGHYETFEANVRFDLRFLADKNLHGCQWFEVRNVQPAIHQRSRSQIELDTQPQNVVPLSIDRADIAPMREFSYDIECVPWNGSGEFPEPEKDPIICIGATVKQAGVCFQAAFCLVPERSMTVDAIGFNGIPVETFVFSDERDLIANFIAFIIFVDPDLMIGYNINGFDDPYIIRRSQQLQIKKKWVNDFSRILHRSCNVHSTVFKSRAHGTKKSFLMPLVGRINYDLYVHYQRNEKLPFYALNYVAEKYLGDRKEDVPHFMLYGLYKGSADDRRRIASYCVKDTLLPLQLMEKQRVIVTNAEMCRVSGVPFKWLLERGQQAKTESKMLRYGFEHGYVAPSRAPARRPYRGAIVKDPYSGFYLVPIFVLDFASLYPSIMQAHNLCYTTFVWLRDLERLGLTMNDVTLPPLDDKNNITFGFVKEHVRKGILPMILADYLAKRKIAKKAMADAEEAGDKAIEMLMNARQLALKISANSVYGYTSANKLPWSFISETVTAFGRDMITDTTTAVEGKFRKCNIDVQTCLDMGMDPNFEFGPTQRPYYEFDAKVIYGDTDSVMVKTTESCTVLRAQQLGRQASRWSNQFYKKPNSLEFEKVYFPFLLQCKKRYSGMFWTKPDKPDKMDSKGIEIVRRDWTGFTTDVMKICLHEMLMNRNVDNAIKAVHQACSNLLLGKVDISKLILTKGFSKTMETYEAGGKTVPVHIKVVKNMMKRDPGSAPKVGDRVSYVMIKGIMRERTAKGWGDTKTSERAEDPLYVIKNDIPIDAEWYIENQLKKPLIRLMQPALCKDEKELADTDEFYEKNPEKTTAYRILFMGKHMLEKQRIIPKKGPLVGHFSRTPTCFHCRVPARRRDDGSYEPTCGNPKCKEIVCIDTYRVTFEKTREAKQQCQDTCVKCQKGMAYESIICQNKMCNNWYQRYKTAKDYEKEEEKIKRFNLDW